MKIVFATNNPNKLSEIKALVPANIEIVSLKEIGCFDELPETQNTLKGNALQKAEYVSKKYNIACFSDDSGLMVKALNGTPGVFSARYAGPNCSSEDNMDKLLTALKNEENRQANFATVIALIINGEKHFFKGEIAGTISTERTGKDGFGYDPIFIPENETRSFAEMGKDEKGKMSHRGRAVEKLVEFLGEL